MTNKTEILFQKFLDGTCTQQEFSELMELLQTNQHEDAVRAMLQKVYQEVEHTLPSFTYVDSSGSLLPEQQPQPEPVQPKIVRSYLPRLTAAAAILLAVSLLTWVLLRQRTSAPQLANRETRATEKKEQKYLVLSDGTQVWLNAASELTYPPSFEGKARVVYLTGEAFFDVKNAEKVPFIIHTGKVITKVLGTAFNIRAYPEQQDVRVEVKRGKVQVSRGTRVMATLIPGEAVNVPAAEKAPERKTVKEEEVAGWTSGKLRYDYQSLKEIFIDLERHFNVQIEVPDEAWALEEFKHACNSTDTVEQAMEGLLVASGTTYEKKDGKYIIKKNR